MNRRSFLQALGLAVAAPALAKIATPEALPARKVRVPMSRGGGRLPVTKIPPLREVNLRSPYIPKLWDEDFIRKFHQRSFVEMMKADLDGEIMGDCKVTIRRRS